MAEWPSPPGSRIDRKALARSVLAQRRQAVWVGAIYAITFAVLLGVVAWHIEWRWWIPLGVAVILSYIYGQQMFGFGWDMRLTDEQVRTMGEWRIHGSARNGEPVTLTGRMVYTRPADVGRLSQFVHVDLSADD